jgi:hypothetical protein
VTEPRSLDLRATRGSCARAGSASLEVRRSGRWVNEKLIIKVGFGVSLPAGNHDRVYEVAVTRASRPRCGVTDGSLSGTTIVHIPGGRHASRQDFEYPCPRGTAGLITCQPRESRSPATSAATCVKPVSDRPTRGGYVAQESSCARLSRLPMDGAASRRARDLKAQPHRAVREWLTRVSVSTPADLRPA